MRVARAAAIVDAVRVTTRTMPSIKWLMLACLAGELMFTFGSLVWAGDSVMQAELIKATKNWMRVRKWEADLSRTSVGNWPVGEFRIWGESAVLTEADPVGSGEKAILRMASQLEIPPEGVLVEQSVRPALTIPGSIDMLYRLRIAGMVLQDWQLTALVRADGTVSSLKGRMPELSDTCRSAWEGEGIDLETAEMIVREDLLRIQRESDDPMVSSPRFRPVGKDFHEVAYAQPPCRVWSATGGYWRYTIDSITGKILKRQDGRIP